MKLLLTTDTEGDPAAINAAYIVCVQPAAHEEERHCRCSIKLATEDGLVEVQESMESVLAKLRKLK